MDNIKVDLNKDNLPFGNGSVNYCFLSHVIEHLYDPNKMLSEVYRILKLKGKFLIITPDFEKMDKQLFFSNPNHVKGYSKKTLHDILVKKFNNVRVFGFSNIPIIWRFSSVAFDIYWKWKKYLFLMAVCQK